MPQPLEMNIDADGLIELKVHGNLTHEEVPQLEEATSTCTLKIKEISEAKGKKLNSLFDASDFAGKYDGAAMNVFVNYVKNNKPYFNKTAIFGATGMAKLAIEAIISLARRDHIQIFDTREAAIAWINQA